jgi:hypothetical protein
VKFRLVQSEIRGRSFHNSTRLGQSHE